METRRRNTTLWIVIGVVLVVLCCAAIAITAVVTVLGIGGFGITRIERGWEGGPTQEETVEQTFEVGEAPRLVVDNFAGDVIVRTGEDNVIRVVATKRAFSRDVLDRIRVDMEPQADGLRIRTSRPTSSVLGNFSVQLQITAPAGTSLDVQTGAGTVEARGFSGAIKVDTGAGDVRIQDTIGDVDAHTGAGGITIRGTTGLVRADTGAGSIEYEGSPEGDCNFQTGAGSIRLALPPDANVKVDLTTGIGDIETAFDVDGDVSRRRVQGVIGTGEDATIRAHTGTGSVDLERQ